MSEPYLAEIKVVSFGFPPRGWALCNGQLLPINQNQALFSLLGTTYGGDGRVNFALPNLQGRMPMHFSAGHPLGEQGGATTATLVASDVANHSHAAAAATGPADATGAADNVLASPATAIYGAPGSPVTGQFGVLAAAALGGPNGGALPHSNQQPYLGLNFVIALVGLFPSQN